VATELGCDFGGAALQKVVAVKGLSIPTTVRSLSVPSCSFVEDVTEGDTVNKTTHIVTCCKSTAPLRSLCVFACGWAAGVRTEPSFESGRALLGKIVAVNELSTPVTASSFRAPRCRVADGMTEGGATEPSFDVGGTVLQEVVVVNGLSILVTASSLSELKYSVEEDVIQGVAVDDSADILGRCASTTTLSRVRVWTFGLASGVVRGLRADFWWDCASGNRHHAWAVVPNDDNKLECAMVLGCGGCDRGWRYR